jgi:hypothetical protein
MKFSERYNLSPKKVIQKNSLNDETIIKLWNFFVQHQLNLIRTFRRSLDHTRKRYVSRDNQSLYDLASNYIHVPREDFPDLKHEFNRYMKEYFFRIEWYRIFELLEWGYSSLEPIIDKVNNNEWKRKDEYATALNQALGEEIVAYRIVDGKIIEITDDSEIEELENALTNENNLSGVKEHLRTAIELMAKKPNPDYRNSIKESISAVEALCSLISGKNQSLGVALNAIKSKIGLDSHLEEGFRNIYKFTSDANGIRHALMADPNLDTEDARFMLVSCATFINYLIVKADKASISLEK